MKKHLSAILVILLIVPALLAESVDTLDYTYPELVPESHFREASQGIARLLTVNHYQRQRLDDVLSAKAFDNFVDRLDGNKMLLLQSDVDEFEKHRYMFDNYIGSGQVEPIYRLFHVYQQRYVERLKYAFARLEQPFDYTIEESILLDREEEAWASTSAELDEIWRKRIKYDALNLKLAGKEEAKIKDALHKRYNRIRRNVIQMQSEDVFEIIMNALSETFDPHTSYFSPKNYDDFKIRMSQSLEGIGARLTSEDEFTRVVEIVAGGPADKSKQLHPNDRIIGVAQGFDGEIVDVIGWRTDDVVQLIRGKKTTVVRLQLLRADDPPGSRPDTIALVRDKVKLEDQSATSEILEIEHDGSTARFGVITIPSFYADYEAMRRRDRDYKSTSRDVRKLIEDMEDEAVDGLIIDLRRNGGGFLSEAVELTGLFIESGPVVQVRDSHGDVKVERDRNPVQVYDGPLAVLVDRLSASASEIFAAAIQDYDRGIVLGSQSFGKGTVQNAIDLNRKMRGTVPRVGQLKLTVAKFYRVDGRSTQHVGVIPDITFPSRFSETEIGESANDNALLWDEIDGVHHYEYESNDAIIPKLNRNHKLRLSASAEYAEYLSEIQEMDERRNRKYMSLNEEVRLRERDEEERKDEADSEEEEEDILLSESAKILADYIELTQPKETNINR